jgi:hypothetical protein
MSYVGKNRADYGPGAMSSEDRNRWELHRTNGREVEIVRDLSGAPLTLRTATLLAERDRNAGTRSVIVPAPGRASGRITR